MGKAQKLKIIRKAALLLPAATTTTIQKSSVSGRDLIDSGVKQDKYGAEIKGNRRYIKRQPIEVPVNHNRQMKRLYNQHGMAGAVAYANQVEGMAVKSQENGHVPEG